MRAGQEVQLLGVIPRASRLLTRSAPFFVWYSISQILYFNHHNCFPSLLLVWFTKTAGTVESNLLGKAPENTMTASFCRSPVHMCRAQQSRWAGIVDSSVPSVNSPLLYMYPSICVLSYS